MRATRLATVLATCLLLLALPTASRAADPKPGGDDPRATLEEWLKAEKIEYEEPSLSFFMKLQDAGCSPSQAYRWVRMALFADPSWNLSDLSGMIEMQMIEGATRQVVEDEVERRVLARAKELETKMAGFEAALRAPVGGAKAKRRGRRGKKR